MTDRHNKGSSAPQLDMSTGQTGHLLVQQSFHLVSSVGNGQTTATSGGKVGNKGKTQNFSCSLAIFTFSIYSHGCTEYKLPLLIIRKLNGETGVCVGGVYCCILLCSFSSL